MTYTQCGKKNYMNIQRFKLTEQSIINNGIDTNCKKSKVKTSDLYSA